MLKSLITDQSTRKTAEVVEDEISGHNTLIVATVPLREFENASKFFTNGSAGIDMNVDAGFSGTPEYIHDGTDNVYWTASDIVGGGKTTFNSSDRNHTLTGALSIKVDNAPVGDVYQIAKGSDMIMGDYVALSLWINVDKDWKQGDIVELYGWDTNANVQVGTAVDLKNYFNYDTYDVWHQLVIPLTDFGDLSESITLDAIRISQTASRGKAPKYYLDDVQFEELGAPVKYTIKADLSTWLYIDSFTISIVGNIDSTLSNSTMPNLAYDSFLGVTMLSGLNYKREKDGVILFSANVLTLMDLLQQPNTKITGSGYDGTNTWVTLQVVNAEPLVLKAENEDELSFTVSDDLSSLLHLRISAACRLEHR